MEKVSQKHVWASCFIESSFKLLQTNRITNVFLAYNNSLLFYTPHNTFGNYIFRTDINGNFIESYYFQHKLPKFEMLTKEGDVILYKRQDGKNQGLYVYSLKTKTNTMITRSYWGQIYCSRNGGWLCRTQKYWEKGGGTYFNFYTSQQGYDQIAQLSRSKRKNRTLTQLVGDKLIYIYKDENLKTIGQFMRIEKRKVIAENVNLQGKGTTGIFSESRCFRPLWEIEERLYFGTLHQGDIVLNHHLTYCIMRLQYGGYGSYKIYQQFVLEDVIALAGEKKQNEIHVDLRYIENNSLMITSRIIGGDPSQHIVRLFDLTTRQSQIINSQTDQQQYFFVGADVIVKLKKRSEQQQPNMTTGKILFRKYPLKQLYMGMLLHIEQDFDDDLLQDTIELLCE